MSEIKEPGKLLRAYEVNQYENAIRQTLGSNNGIDPCPFCGAKEGENVILGYKYPNFRITCVPCAVVMQHDRKDKVIGIWNNRFNPNQNEQ